MVMGVKKCPFSTTCPESIHNEYTNHNKDCDGWLLRLMKTSPDTDEYDDLFDIIANRCSYQYEETK